MWIGTVNHCREIDRRASDEFGIPTRILMERAGLAVFEAIRELLPNGGAITVFCGRGNNGGDGFVVARAANEAGYDVQCVVAASEEDLREAATEQYQIALASGVKPTFASDPCWSRKLECLGKRDLIVDALLGTGGAQEVRGHVKDAIESINRSGVPVVSVDVPSGIDANTGEELGESVWALRTVTFGLPKRYLFEGIGVEHAGYWTVSDIGVPHALLSEPTDAFLIENDWVADLLPERMKCSHKGDNGSVLIVAGSRKMPGAATMAAKAALRAGTGLVTVAAIQSVCDAVAGHLPEVLFVPLPEQDGAVAPHAAKILLEIQNHYNAAVFGPGMTHEAPVREFLSAVFKSWNIPSVVDADALNAVSLGVQLPKAEVVMTPHPGEMSRLLESSVAEIQADRFGAMASAISKYGKAVLLKGPYSIVGEGDQPMVVNQTGNPGMACGGMGDILSGVIVSLLAHDLPSYYAAACGMYWHGFAGDLAAEEVGCVGFTATEVADRLPHARARITAPCDACS
jgi:NAD(P)H-hydrate epimerase